MAGREEGGGRVLRDSDGGEADGDVRGGEKCNAGVTVEMLLCGWGRREGRRKV